MPARKLKCGMIGGGKDAFIGAIHRLAFNMDGQVELVAGALSVSPEAPAPGQETARHDGVDARSLIRQRHRTDDHVTRCRRAQ